MRYAVFAAAIACCAYFISVRTAKRHGLRMRVGAVGIGFVFAALAAAYYASSFPFALAAATCAVAAVTDLCSGYVFDAIVIPAIAAVFALQIVSGHVPFALAGFCVAGGVPLLLFACTRGSGMGFGDVKLGGCIGAALGAPASVTALQVAFVAGAVAALFLLIVQRAPRKTAIAFAPYLAAGTFVAGVFHPGR